jgi:ankyrin repeat protein
MDSRRPNSGLPVSTDIHSSGNGVEVANTENPYFQLPIRQRVSISESSDQDAAWKESSDLGPTFTATMDESDSDASRTVFTPEAGLSEEEETEPDNVEAKVPGSTSSVSWMQQRDFYEAIERGDVEAVRVFLTEGCTVDRKTDNGYTPLVIAILEGQLEVAELLLGNYASAHQRVNKLPPIVHAVIKPNIPLQCIQLLLNYGAILTTPFGPYYYNALHWAISNGNVDAVDLLVCRGMDMEETCDGGRTALQVAAKFGMTTIAKLLLAKGANINHRSHNGNTALIWAAYHGHAETVQLLVNEGMDVNDCNGADVSESGMYPLI